MLFNSAIYAAFLALVFLLNWGTIRVPALRQALLLAASYAFYANWDPRFLGLILFSTVLDLTVGHALGRVQDRRLRRLWLGVSLVGNLGVLAFFKYFDFFAEQAAALLGAVGLAADPLTLELLLPVGISFYTFQTLSYTIDVYRGELEPERSPLRFALFVAFFPQLVAGPIVRARDFLPQLRVTPSLPPAVLRSGLVLIFWGLTKKVLLADVLGAELVDPAWEDPSAYGGLASALAIVGYAFQIYGDFSGYSDVAIGSARLLGFDLGTNFRAPYRATSPQDLWRRWHISLSSWLRDYLYIPLGGNRSGPTRTQVNLALTMLLGGLWHGASWMYVLWGGYHGLLLAVDRKLPAPKDPGAIESWLRRAVTFALVCLGWVFFRSATPDEAQAVLRSLAAPRGDARVGWLVAAVLAMGVAVHLPPRAFKRRVSDAVAGLPSFVQGVLLALLVGLFLNAAALRVPFIYFQF
jgi:alginate O-acetyltransferase complex protein AlgI